VLPSRLRCDVAEVVSVMRRGTVPGEWVGGGAGPELRKGIGTGVAARQWVMNGYTLTLAAFLLTGGSLGDRFGRREVYLIGIVWFALASAACELAPM
jgi:MFS family permease